MTELHAQTQEKKVMLVVLAHPDDETFGMGGTLAYYARHNVDVHLICATRGEVGDMSPEFLEGYSNIADRRTAELRCAAGLLGLKGVHFLDYRDSGMPGTPENRHPQALINAPLERVAAEVAEIIRRIKPQVVVTFDPIGGYRHPDHIHIHQATVMAFQNAGDARFTLALPPYQPQKLYYQTISRTALRWMVRLMPLVGRDPRKFGKNGDIDLKSIADADFPTHAVIDYRSVAEIRDQASACHASQGGQQMVKGPLGKIRRLLGSKETFMRAIPPASSAVKEQDLFEGIQYS